MQVPEDKRSMETIGSELTGAVIACESGPASAPSTLAQRQGPEIAFSIFNLRESAQSADKLLIRRFRRSRPKRSTPRIPRLHLLLRALRVLRGKTLLPPRKRQGQGFPGPSVP